MIALHILKMTSQRWSVIALHNNIVERKGVRVEWNGVREWKGVRVEWKRGSSGILSRWDLLDPLLAGWLGEICSTHSWRAQGCPSLCFPFFSLKRRRMPGSVPERLPRPARWLLICSLSLSVLFILICSLYALSTPSSDLSLSQRAGSSGIYTFPLADF